MNVYGQILSDIVEPAKIWIAENGLDFAGRIVAASVILLIGAIAIMFLARFLRKLVAKHTGDKVLFAPRSPGRCCLRLLSRSSG